MKAHHLSSEYSKNVLSACVLSMSLLLGACGQQTESASSKLMPTEVKSADSTWVEKSDEKTYSFIEDTREGNIVVYQVFTRLFGNKNATNKQWGTMEENGVGKFADFTDKALEGIKELGVSHIWYTGVLHHAVINDYTKYGIQNDDPDVVKGRAGSPYAVKDYYNVNPDLAIDPSKRLQEFEALIERSHRHGLKVIIDIVPNHVARNYQSLSAPEGVEDFGASDDKSVEYKRDNNFYYVIGESFKVPEWEGDYQPLGGEPHPLADRKFDEHPAKWTGNGSRSAQPKMDDWYETVKINYGVKPDGSYDFPKLTEDFRNKDYKAHYEYWKTVDVPDSWIKYRQICEYWIDKGIDGFRFDVAELVPVEFWSYLNSAIKMKNPDAFLLAEIYTPPIYRDFLQLGKMDYLYDKVDFYDRMREIIRGEGSTDSIIEVQNTYADIADQLLHFLENHDEQRIASPAFAGNANYGKPAMVVTATISKAPTMLYIAQDIGDAGEGDAGFGDPTRTTIFDYWGIPSHQRWMNDGKFDGALLTKDEKQLREFYIRLMNLSAKHPAMAGEYAEIHSINREKTKGYSDQQIAYVRWKNDARVLVVSNFLHEKSVSFDLIVPAEIISAWKLKDGSYALLDKLYETRRLNLTVHDGQGIVELSLDALESLVLELE